MNWLDRIFYYGIEDSVEATRETARLQQAAAARQYEEGKARAGKYDDLIRGGNLAQQLDDGTLAEELRGSGLTTPQEEFRKQVAGDINSIASLIPWQVWAALGVVVLLQLASLFRRT
jgi:hypothetical protein